MVSPLRERVEAVAAGQAPDRCVRLAVEGVRVAGNADVTVRAFLGEPDAGAASPLDDPRYLGSFTFSHGAEDGGETAFLLDASPALARVGPGAVAEDGVVTLTLVASPLGRAADPAASIAVGRVVLSLFDC